VAAGGDRRMNGVPLVGYQYVVLRCVPRVDREEFINVGVVVYCQDRDFLESAHLVDARRLRALEPGIDVDAVGSALEAIAAMCRGEPTEERPEAAPAGTRFGFVSAPRSTVIQPGPVHGGLTPDPQRELANLLDRLVG